MRRILLIAIALLLFHEGAIAQTRTVTGTVAALSTATGNCAATDAGCLTLPKGTNDPLVSVSIAWSPETPFIGTLQFEGASDGAANPNNWQPLNTQAMANGATTTTTTPGTWIFPAADLTGVRVRATAYTSGSANVTLQIRAVNVLAPASSSACTGTVYDSGSLQVPTGYPSALQASSVCVTSITFNNSTLSPITVTVRDGSGNGNNYVSLVYPFTPVTVPFNNILFSGGIQWTASSSGLNGQVKGYQ